MVNLNSCLCIPLTNTKNVRVSVDESVPNLMYLQNHFCEGNRTDISHFDNLLGVVSFCSVSSLDTDAMSRQHSKHESATNMRKPCPN